MKQKFTPEELSQKTVEDLRMIARDASVRWQDDDNKPLRKTDLVEALEKHYSSLYEPQLVQNESGYRAAVAIPPTDANAPAIDHVPNEGDQTGRGGHDPQSIPTPPNQTPPEERHVPNEGDQTGRGGHPPAQTAGPEYFRIVNDSKFFETPGVASRLPKGTVVSSLSHNIAEMQRQGIVMEPGDPPKAALDAYGSAVNSLGLDYSVGNLAQPVAVPESQQSVVLMVDGTRKPVSIEAVPVRGNIESRVE